ncbi:MAG: RidA family protein [Candidatus Kryptoniota bacterium]
MKIIYTKDAPQPIGPYSQGIEVDGLLFLSGQIGLKPETGAMTDGLTGQTRQIIKNISALLQSAGCSLSNVVRSTIYLQSMNDFAEFNKVYSEYFNENPPARTTVEVSTLPRNALVEIDIIAHK